MVYASVSIDNECHLNSCDIFCFQIKVGSLVHLNKCAMYQAGAIAINPNGGHPKVGRLLQPVWNLSETCPFKVGRLHRFMYT